MQTLILKGTWQCDRGGVGHPLTNQLFPKSLGHFKPFTLNCDREMLGKFSDRPSSEKMKPKCDM